MKKLSPFVLCVASVVPLFAQMTPSQRMLDIQVLASIYAKQYAPYEWKRDVFQFDMLNLAPWVERARTAKDDLEFYQIMAEYVGSLNDAHSTYFNQSDFAAELPINVDIYDGKVLIDVLVRSLLPIRDFPFDVGDELISIDGKPVADLLTEFAKIDSFANPLSTRRWAADKLAYRFQGQVPRAIELGDTAEVVIKLKNGTLGTYNIKWIKSGYPLKKIGPVPSPRMNSVGQKSQKTSVLEQSLNDAPPYLKTITKLQYWKARQKRSVPHQDQVEKPEAIATEVDTAERTVKAEPPKEFVLGFAELRPVFDNPTGFVQRLGRGRSDYFYSGTYNAQGKRIGYIRIADFQPLPFSLLSLATRQFDTEMAFFNANTDGLVVDVMRNPGGFGCYADQLFRRVTTKPFRTMGQEVRPTVDLVVALKQSLADAQDFGATENELIWLTGITRDVETAYNENRGRTGALPLLECGLILDVLPTSNSSGVPTGYTKPAILLTDEFTTSAGDAFAAIFQDNKRGPLVGMRTAGAGGAVIGGIAAGYYSEGFTSVTATMMVRPNSVAIPGYPVTNYVENVGVHPDIKVDYMTVENLAKGGAPFVAAFTNAIVAEINRPK